MAVGEDPILIRNILTQTPRNMIVLVLDSKLIEMISAFCMIFTFLPIKTILSFCTK